MNNSGESHTQFEPEHREHELRIAEIIEILKQKEKEAYIAANTWKCDHSCGVKWGMCIAYKESIKLLGGTPYTAGELYDCLDKKYQLEGWHPGYKE